MRHSRYSAQGVAELVHFCIRADRKMPRCLLFAACWTLRAHRMAMGTSSLACTVKRRSVCARSIAQAQHEIMKPSGSRRNDLTPMFGLLAVLLWGFTAAAQAGPITLSTGVCRPARTHSACWCSLRASRRDALTQISAIL